MAPGDPGAVYTVERDELPQDVYLRFGSGSAEILVIKTMYYLAGFGFWCVGAILLFLRARDERASLLTLCCFVVALTMAVLPFADLLVDWASRVAAALLMIISPMFVHYHSVFPERKTFKGRRELLAVLYATGTLFILARASFSAAYLNEIGVFVLLSGVMRLFLSLCVLLGLALLVHTQLATSNMLIKRQATLMVLGTGLSVTSMMVLVVGPQTVAGTYLVPPYVVNWLLFLIPLSYAYTTYRHRLMSIDPKVNRTVVIATLALVIIAAFWALWEVIAWLTPFFFPSIGPEVAALIAVIIIGFGITPLKESIQKLVDRAFYGGWYSYRSIVDKVARNLNRVRDMDALTHQLVDGLTADMRVQAAALITSNDEQPDFHVQKAIGFDDTVLTASRIRKDGALAKYLTQRDEPIEHSQLVSRLQDGTDVSRDELSAWHGAQLWVPLVKDGALEGILVLGLKQVEDFFDTEDRQILSTLAKQAAIALQNVRLIEELKHNLVELDRMYHELQLVREEEQTRLGRDIHDTIIQSLISMNFRVQQGIADPQVQERIMMGLRDDIGQMIADSRSLCAELHSPVLQDFGLAAAIKDYLALVPDEDKFSVEADLPPCQPDWLTQEQQVCLYRVLQEGLANVRRHSHATLVAVKLTFENSYAALSVSDNGHGFVVPDRLGNLVKSNRFGLAGMVQRVASLGGTLHIDAEAQQGTQLQVQLPRLLTASTTLVVEKRNGWSYVAPKP